MKTILVFKDVVHERNTSKFHRKTGCSLPLHIYQFLSIFVTFIISFIHYYVVLPISVFNNTLFYVISSLLLLLVVVFYTIVSLIDPVDPNASSVIYPKTEYKNKIGKFLKYFSKTQTDSNEKTESLNPNFGSLNEVKDTESKSTDSTSPLANPQNGTQPSNMQMEMSHCNVCEYVDPSSKHCNVCNKCITKFDHHCVWVNNCIGSVNYLYFILLLLFALVFLTYNYVLTFYIVFSFKDIALAHEKFRALVLNISNKYFKAVLLGSGLFNLIPFLFLLYLFVFHLFLIYTGQTTYQYYIRRMEQLDNGKSSEVQDAEEGPRQTRCFDYIIIKKRRLKNKQKETKESV
ncbi:DHHC palmitoyltransferase family protein [Theileria parva strain Muguga]|uniref:DHHC palmitoyltransferase family protein n=1 Tax=Theileria parva strain Muguga TaxID=333668 RepID=UPI001C61F38F|nr:DHHC palmitoyltransferase family protein [Theileria parva strain Muguga]KAF5153146.1 DHHC palmitoyltransferase family protein [Theileria parva strain Muguga]